MKFSSIFSFLLNPGIEPGSSALQADSLPSEPLGKPHNVKQFCEMVFYLWFSSRLNYQSESCKQFLSFISVTLCILWCHTFSIDPAHS